MYQLQRESFTNIYIRQTDRTFEKELVNTRDVFISFNTDLKILGTENKSRKLNLLILLELELDAPLIKFL